MASINRRIDYFLSTIALFESYKLLITSYPHSTPHTALRTIYHREHREGRYYGIKVIIDLVGCNKKGTVTTRITL